MSAPLHPRRFTLTVVDSAEWCAEGTTIDCVAETLDGLLLQAAESLNLVGVSIEVYDADFQEWTGPLSLDELDSKPQVRVSAESRSPNASSPAVGARSFGSSPGGAAVPAVPKRNAQSENMRKEREQRSSLERAVRGAMAAAQERLEASDFDGLPDDDGGGPAAAAAAGAAIQQLRVACEAQVRTEVEEMWRLLGTGEDCRERANEARDRCTLGSAVIRRCILPAASGTGGGLWGGLWGRSSGSQQAAQDGEPAQWEAVAVRMDATGILQVSTIMALQNLHHARRDKQDPQQKQREASYRLAGCQVTCTLSAMDQARATEKQLRHVFHLQLAPQPARESASTSSSGENWLLATESAEELEEWVAGLRQGRNLAVFLAEMKQQRALAAEAAAVQQQQVIAASEALGCSLLRELRAIKCGLLPDVSASVTTADGGGPPPSRTGSSDSSSGGGGGGGGGYLALPGARRLASPFVQSRGYVARPQPPFQYLFPV